MANRRLANSVTKKLLEIDSKLYREWMKKEPSHKREEQLERQQAEVIKDARKRGIKMINVPVADGTSIYWETNRTTKLVTFEWLYGGPDMYVSSLGKLVAVPVEQADKLIRHFKMER